MIIEEKKTVCIIDDDPHVLKLCGTKLKNEGFKVLTADNGEKGITLIKAHRPDIILLDIMMPVKDGLSVLKDLQNDSTIAKIPVIILSNVSDTETVKKVGEFSTHFYVVKSLTTLQKIADLIKETLAGRS